MTDLPGSFVHLISQGGMAARHSVPGERIVLVGPSTSTEVNTISPGIIPIACWRVDNIRFGFDSSVVEPEMAEELRHLADLLLQHPPASRTKSNAGCPLSVFGHTDPTGDDDYNKQLSGRRATAVYALLTRRIDLWEQLYSQPFGNDKWGRRALEIMTATVSQSEAFARADMGSVARCERNRGDRAALFSDYMEKLCGAELKLEAGDFLARGEDRGGKGDYQGCSEFNPVKVPSHEERSKFERAREKQERDTANAPNRRVVVLIFRAGSRVSPNRWPCPRVSEGVSGCRKRFWSDGAKRRAPTAESRTIETSRDTFACRLYDRLTIHSPCDRSSTVLAPIVLDDPLLGPAKGVIVRLAYEDGLQEQTKSDARGVVMAKISHGAFVDVIYEREDVVGSGRVFILPPHLNSEAGVWQRLVNLGYSGTNRAPAEPPTPEHLALAVEEFQSEFGRTPDGRLDAETRQLIGQAHDKDDREWMLRDWQREVETGPDVSESKARIT